MIVKSDEARARFRELLDHAEHGGDVRILRYQRPVAVMTSPDPNSLDDRLVAMAAILREAGSEDAAEQVATGATYIRETWRGADDYDIAEALDRIAEAAKDLAELARARPSAARKADMDARGSSD